MNKRPSVTVAEKLRIAQGRPSGFDYIRLTLATSVVVWHTIVISEGEKVQSELWASMLRGVPGLILPMFFALSGFLVAGSLGRSKSLISFLGLRVLRIAPALIVETTLSAMVLGILFTTLPIQRYFSNPQFRSYLLNTVGDVHFYLPGVFTHNPTPLIVNGQLWTVPKELLCYVVLAALALVNLVKSRSRVLAGFIILQIITVLAAIWKHHTAAGPVLGLSLVQCFLAGVLIFYWRDAVPWRHDLGLLSGATTLILLYMPFGRDLLSVPSAYFVVYLGTMNLRRLPVIFSGDYSYGIFLYGFPIQQAVVASTSLARTPLFNFMLAFPMIMFTAVASWWIVERPALALKPMLMRREDAWLRWRLKTPLFIKAAKA